MKIVTHVLAAALIAVVGVSTPAAALADTDPVGQWPLQPQPEVVEAFDPPESTWGSGHRGVDLSGRLGQPVRAALPGRVAFVGTIAGRPVVTVDHGNTRTTYEPVATTLSPGTRVAGAGVIGTLSVLGSPLPPCRMPPLGLAARQDLSRPLASRRRWPGAVNAAEGAVRGTSPADRATPVAAADSDAVRRLAAVASVATAWDATAWDPAVRRPAVNGSRTATCATAARSSCARSPPATKHGGWDTLKRHQVDETAQEMLDNLRGDQ